MIPGKTGSLLRGERLLNYVWYCNYAADSPEFVNLMTDIDGHRHRITMPIGKMRPEMWSAQKEFATEVLPAAFAEIVLKTEQPLVQCITDVSAPKAVHFNVRPPFPSLSLLIMVHSLVSSSFQTLTSPPLKPLYTWEANSV